MKFWQHEETGLTVWAENEPSGRWLLVPTVYEDELPADMTDEEYSAWYDRSIVDGVRIGPKLF